jgi:hypothetical protein
MELMNKKVFLIGWIIVFLPFIISLTQPVYCTEPYQSGGYTQCGETWQGAFMFVLGWLGFLNTSTAIVWFANPLMIIAFGVSFIRPYISVVISAIALWLALKFLDGGDFMLNGGGAKGYVSEFLIGYWLWLLSIGLNLAMNLVLVVLYFKNQD